MIRALVCMAVLGLACGFTLSKVGKNEWMKEFDLLEKMVEKIAIGGGGKHLVAEARSAYRVRAKWDAISDAGIIAVDPLLTSEDECMDTNEGCWFSLAMVRPEEVDDHVNWNTVDILEHRVIAADDEMIVNFMDLAKGVYDMKVCRIESAGNPSVVDDRCNCWKCDIEPEMSEDMWGMYGCAEGTHCDVVPVPVVDVVPESPAADIIESSDEEDSVPDSPAAEIIDSSAEDDAVPTCPATCPNHEDCAMYLMLADGSWVPNTLVTCVSVGGVMMPNPNYPNSPYFA